MRSGTRYVIETL